jgi:ribosomal-protein-alanine N-acetyltransferase
LPDVAPFNPVADTTPLAVLHAASFPDPWDAPAITALLATPGTFAFHHLDGFVLARIAGDEAEILTLAVMRAARGRGLGRALLQAAINRGQELGAVTVFLEVGVDNPAALALYSGLGFTRVGARKAYYAAAGGSGDALVLRLPLPAKFA